MRNLWREMASVYKGRLRNPTDQSIDLPVTLTFDRHQMHVVTEGRSLGWWPLKQVWGERAEENRFVLSIADEPWHFFAEHPAEFLTRGIPQLSAPRPSDRTADRRRRVEAAKVTVAQWALASMTTLLAFAGGLLLGRYRLDGNLAVTSAAIGVLLVLSLIWARSVQRASRPRSLAADKAGQRSPVRVSEAVATRPPIAEQSDASRAVSSRMPASMKVEKAEPKPVLASVTSALSSTEPGSAGPARSGQSLTVRVEPPIDPERIAGPPPEERPPMEPASLTAPAPQHAASPGNGPDAQLKLSMIKGIGPVFADWLFELGIRDVTQLAMLDDEEVDRMVHKMGRFGNRIRADDWVGQARRLLEREEVPHG